MFWKVISIIIDRHMMDSIEFHDVLHGFRAWGGTGTAALEAKLLQQIMDMLQEVLFDIFVDLHKAYDTLDRWCDLAVMKGYGVFPQVFCLLTRYWDRMTMAARVSGYYGDPFQGSRGVTQG